MAPEIIRGEQYRFECDIWSLGVILYELCSFRCPFDTPYGVSLKNIKRASYSELSPGYSAGLRKLIYSMLNKVAKKRPTILQVLEEIEKLLKQAGETQYFNFQTYSFIKSAKVLSLIKGEGIPGASN